MAQKRDEIRGALKYAWDGYKNKAWGQDELHPVSGQATNWIGLGLTIVDALDTLWIAGLMKEYKEGRDWVAANMNFNKVISKFLIFQPHTNLLNFPRYNKCIDHKI